MMGLKLWAARRRIIEEVILALYEDPGVNLVLYHGQVTHPIEAWLPSLSLWVRKYDGYITGKAVRDAGLSPLYPSLISRHRIRRAFNMRFGHVPLGVYIDEPIGSHMDMIQRPEKSTKLYGDCS